MDFPTGQYSVIYADPPWSYNDKMASHTKPTIGLEGWEGVDHQEGHSFGLEDEYVTQDIDWIKKLPVQSIAAKDCVCFMWAVSPQLPEGIATLEAWGFKFVTVAFVWNKQYKGTNNDVLNLGRWTMGNVELCLLGRRGHPKRISKNVRQLVVEGRGRHSEKPHEVRQRIVTLMGDVPRIELFARKRYHGWTPWGNEVEDEYTDSEGLW